MPIEELLKELGRQMGVPLRLDRNRACRLVFEDKWTIDIEAPAETRDTVFLYGVAGRVPPDADAAFFRTLLEANLFGQETRGATLAIDGARGEVLVQRIVAIDRIDFAGFVAVLEELIRALATWIERLAAAGHRAAAGGSDALPSDGFIRA